MREQASLPAVPVEVRNVSQRPDRTSVFDGRPDRARRAEVIYARDFEVYGY